MLVWDGVREEKWTFVPVFTLETVSAHHTEYKWWTFLHLGKNMALQDWRSRSNKERKLTMMLLQAVCFYCKQCVNVVILLYAMFYVVKWRSPFTAITLCLPSLYVVHPKGANFVFVQKNVLPVYICKQNTWSDIFKIDVALGSIKSFDVHLLSHHFPNGIYHS